MKFLINTVLTALFAFTLGLFFPWWTIAVAAFISALLAQPRPWAAFFSGFLGIFLLWVILAQWLDSRNEHILSSRIGELLGVGANPIVMVLVTGVIGGLVGGLAGLSASFILPGNTKRA